MLGVCKLCQKTREILDSHVFSKFVIRWMKETGTGYLRAVKQPNLRKQDGSTEKLLCRECEQRFSNNETYFASKVFYPMEQIRKCVRSARGQTLANGVIRCRCKGRWLISAGTNHFWMRPKKCASITEWNCPSAARATTPWLTPRPSAPLSMKRCSLGAQWLRPWTEA